MGFFSKYQSEDGQGPPQPPNSSPRLKPFFSPKRVFRSQSSQDLRNASFATASQQPDSQSSFHNATPDLNTLPDPRNSTDAPMATAAPTSHVNQHPDLSNEVAALSTKLINAINHQTSLDDSLQSSRHELEAARVRISQLELALKEHQDLVSNGVLVKRVDTEKVANTLRTELAEERVLRTSADKQRKGMEMELENLTSALFEEANTMVAEARRNSEQADRRNEQLKVQLRDSENLLTSHQQQLRALKTVLEKIQQERDEEDRAQASTAPHTPTTSAYDHMSRSQDLRSDPHPVLALVHVSPEPPLRFSNIIRPVLRFDLAAYDEFVTILRSGVRTSPHSRVSSGSMGGLNVMGLSSATTYNQSTISTTSSQATNTSLATVANPSPLSSPSLPGSFNSTSPSDSANAATTLEKTKFYKRVFTEDIEPTLRLDTAPGLSWLVRRSVVSSMVSGLLVIEPWPPGSRFHSPVFPCSLCGEQRKEESYVRRHRFRTTESDDAQRYPLCEYCLERVRATCELVGFLKLIKGGQFRADGADEARLAWEDCVKLRERMFWSRMAGGVVPVAQRDSMAIATVTSNLASTPILEAEEPGASAGSEEPAVETDDTTSPVLPPRPAKPTAVGEEGEHVGDRAPVLSDRPTTSEGESDMATRQAESGATGENVSEGAEASAAAHTGTPASPEESVAVLTSSIPGSFD